MQRSLSMNNHDVKFKYQLQVASSQINGEMFSFEGIKTVVGKHCKAQTQLFFNHIIENEENFVSFCSDDGSEQKISTPNDFYRFRDILHAQIRTWTSFCDENSIFTFENGDDLNVREAFNLLSPRHPELQNFALAFKLIEDLSSATKSFAYIVQENIFVGLGNLCEQKIQENENLKWFDLLKFAQLMTTLGLVFKSFFIEMDNEERIIIFSSALIRLSKYELQNRDPCSFTHFKSSLTTSLKFLRENENVTSQEFFLKSTLAVLENIKWQMKTKAKILTVGDTQRMYEIFAQGCTLKGVDGPFGHIVKIVCVPSVPYIE